MIWHGQIGILQGTIQRGPHRADGLGAVQLFPVDEHFGRSVYAHRVPIFYGGPDRGLVLRLHAGLQFGQINIVLLSLQCGHPVHRLQTRTGHFFVVHLALVGVNVIREIPCLLYTSRCV